MQHTRSRLSIAAKIVGFALLGIVAAAAVFLAVLTAREYRPAELETAWTSGSANAQPEKGELITVLSFNIGYAGLGQESDFFMDGGRTTRPDSAKTVEKNLDDILEILKSYAPDAALLQETDVSSKRTYDIDERARLSNAFAGEAAFAPNYVCDYVPFPLPDTIGRVESGLLTLSRFSSVEQTRIALPVPFQWPIRVANLKRCLLLTRIPLAGTDAELVLINLHLEAYDDGEGKREQTEQLVKLLQQEYEAGNYVVAGGDFNQRMEGFGNNYPVIDPTLWQPGTLSRDILPQGWTYAFDDASPTCRLLNKPYDAEDPDTQYYVIDGFLCSPNVTVERVATVDAGFACSDHNPVLMQFRLS